MTSSDLMRRSGAVFLWVAEDGRDFVVLSVGFERDVPPVVSESVGSGSGWN